MVAFSVEMGGKLENHLGAVVNAIPAALASIFKDVDNALGNLYVFRIKGNTPKGHELFLKLDSRLIRMDLLFIFLFRTLSCC
jgi:hypothetical protein